MTNRINWQEIIDEVIKENPELPEDIDVEMGRNAVRYGYQYRVVAQRLCDLDRIHINYRLPGVEEILFWLGSAVLSGITYDLLKKAWQTLVKKLKNHNNLSEEAKTVFSSEEKFHEFYEYIREFDDGLVHINESERLYIEEEIRADLSGEISGKIFSKYHRLPTIEEHIEISKKVQEQMDEMLKKETNKNMKLGTLTKIEDLRTIWPHEASDFTPWLAKDENLAMLGDAIGIDLTLIGTEVSVGSFNIDILAVETGSERKVIIENQLEDTNHDHLGKTITYAAGKEAEVVVWIVKNAREEHRKAVEWLNNHTDDNIGFFLIELELWSIDNSAPAPKFNVVERPNDWAKQVKKDTSNSTETEVLRLDYWTELNNYAFSNAEFAKEFRRRKPSTNHWYTLSIGKSGCHINFLMQNLRKEVEIEIEVSDNKPLFHALESHKSEIEDIIGSPLDWRELPDKKASRIVLTRSGVNFSNKADWPSQYDWLMKYAMLFKKAFVPFVG